jgi:hypothetical protein
LTRIKSTKWPVAFAAFAVLLFVVAGGVAVFVSRSSKASNLTIEPLPIQSAAEVPVIPPPAPIESPVESAVTAAPVVAIKQAPVTVTRKTRPRVVVEENTVAVAPSREEPQVATPIVEKPKPRESPVKSAPNPALSPHLLAPAKNAKVIQWP